MEHRPHLPFTLKLQMGLTEGSFTSSKIIEFLIAFCLFSVATALLPTVTRYVSICITSATASLSMVISEFSPAFGCYTLLPKGLNCTTIMRVIPSVCYVMIAVGLHINDNSQILLRIMKDDA
jgi:hypothetical protein